MIFVIMIAAIVATSGTTHHLKVSRPKVGLKEFLSEADTHHFLFVSSFFSLLLRRFFVKEKLP